MSKMHTIVQGSTSDRITRKLRRLETHRHIQTRPDEVHAKSPLSSMLRILLERTDYRYGAFIIGLRPIYETAPGVFVQNVTDSVPTLSVKLELIPENEGIGDDEADATLSDGPRGARMSRVVAEGGNVDTSPIHSDETHRLLSLCATVFRYSAVYCCWTSVVMAGRKKTM